MVLLVMLCITCLLVEVFLRAWESWTQGVPFWSNNSNPTFVSDAELGWVPRPNRSRRLVGEGRYAGTYSTDAMGMRPGWNPGARRGTMLILGDSFTHGVDVPDQALYTRWLAHGLNVEIRAFAAEGYGTAQSLIALERLKKRIQPDWILLQCAANDFINHHYHLESNSRINNALRPRPYFEPESGTFHMRLPGDPLAGSFAPLMKYSRMARRTFAVVLLCRENWGGLPETVETKIIRQQEEHSGFRESIGLTRAILASLKARAGASRLLVFSADNVFPFTKAWEEISQDLDIPFFSEVPQSLGKFSTGRQFFAQDGVHWNPLGHQRVAETLGPWLAQQTELEWNPAHQP